jgi:5-methylcytosine-specific restriction protein B
MSEDDAVDSAIVQKLLPKVHGSRKKVSPVLKSLWQICFKDSPVDIDTLEGFPESMSFKYPLTAEKIWRMYLIAQDNGFTSFAEA